MIVSCHQPNYLPWPGFFHKILKSDVHVILDTNQLPRGKDFVVRNLFISTEENTINNIISLARLYENNLQMLIFDKLIKDGSLNADINLSFDEKGKIRNNYQIKGSVNNIKI